ncbi:plastocyanin/azurin family copper-binding protein [Haloglomus salinum]|jgi:plastocyanin|uniref:plastocyanin/azurin family copper-binding protein n=1 Tax=Haloglomus salinum TaxID=2962673 RepID=UPI0020C9A01A|nr:plastocyanin/azurin family copper-binding protein [Haloglomus salinum]
MKRRTFLATAGAAASVGLAGCGSSAALSDDSYDVGMVHNAFQPVEYEVSAGDTVVWGNVGSRGHSVTAYESLIPADATYFASGGADSQQEAVDGWPGAGNIQPGETYSHTFEVPGEYQYYCIPHEAAGMKGTIVVTE